MAVLHLVDSLAALPVLRGLGVDRFVDIGTGGGFPGLPVAAALPARRALLLDSVGKKVAFVDTVLAATGLAGSVSAMQARAEALAIDPRQREAWPAVLARAVAELGELIELAFPLLAPGGHLIAWKRGELSGELESGERAARALGGGRLEVVEVRATGLDGHRLVVATKDGRTPPGFPRPPAERRRDPWSRAIPLLR